MSPAPTLDRPMLGIVLMLGFCVLIPVSDAMGKHLGAVMAVAQLVTVRFVAQFLITTPIAWTLGGLTGLTVKSLWLMAARGGLQIVGLLAMFTSLRFLPLADAVAIAFVMPFLALLLGWAVLGETVGIRRLSACAVGFVGTLLIIQPSFAAVGWPALLPLLVALVYALFMLVTRAMAKEVDAFTMQGVSGAMACAVLLPALALGTWLGWGPLTVTPVSGGTLWVLVIFGVFGVLAHLFLTWSLSYAPTATLAPIQYLELPIAALVGWVAFREFPNALALVGIAVIMAAGLYLVWREHRLAAKPLPPPRKPRAAG